MENENLNMQYMLLYQKMMNSLWYMLTTSKTEWFMENEKSEKDLQDFLFLRLLKIILIILRLNLTEKDFPCIMRDLR